MQNLYPMFERNRILKKELLWSLRDYSFAHIQLEYQEYSPGILRGCSIRVQGDELAVDPGIIKYGQFICLLMEEERIPYKPADQTQFLKLKLETDRRPTDYIVYRADLSIEPDGVQDEHEFELCRFNLRSGAELRDRYKDFSDMVTEYDTINPLHASWSGPDGACLAPAVTRYFSEIILESENSQLEDRSFAYLCLSRSEAVPAKVLASYIRHRTGGEADAVMDNLGIYKAMCSIIDNIRRGEEKRIKGRKERHRILVD